jgi:GNAT superfamily N-acetyltransferase
MSAELTTRCAGAEDLAAVMALYGLLNPSDPPVSDAQAQGIWQRILGDSSARVLLGEISGQPVTTCMIVIVPNLTRGGRSYAIIENVVTHPDFRKQGHGTAILGEAVRLARLENCYKVVLTTGSKRESTLAFYEKAGFTRNSRTAFEQRF